MLWEVEANASFISLQTWRSLPTESLYEYSQVTEDTFVLNTGDEIYWNHSCNPNCVCDGPRITALRKILPGEELTYDYGFSEIASRWQMACNCGSNECRRTVYNQDYLLWKVQANHKGHIPSYVQRVIERSGTKEKVSYAVKSWAGRLWIRKFGTPIPRPVRWLTARIRILFD